MIHAAPTRSAGSRGQRRRGRLLRRGGIPAFLLLAFGVGWPALAVPVFSGIPAGPFLLFLVFIPLLGSALFVTRVADGPGAVRRLLSRAFLWRFGIGRWLVILFGLPALTVLLAAVSGTLVSPEGGWVVELGWYLFNTLIFGALTLNLWEETTWGGFVQSRLMARHGLVGSSLLTAVIFAGIHVPLEFAGDRAWSDIAVSLGLLFVAAPVYRYLVGMHLLDTGGSILAIGVQHASWNAIQRLDVVEGGSWEWQALAATVLLTVLVAVGRRLGAHMSRPMGREAERAAARTWITGPASATAPDHRSSAAA
ncbi:hypothetical protein SAMN05660657_05340 [Geodermatophilus amargosae]|uniref:CAAX prenyl protease 2/Lysostaphin resistance protein A-like domain-containing protein n=1 Tax=Geodermatophilus amargosae TaxID=1296565 RepID=A0A1I7D5E8_9ACTN|nr:CPBP family glutamic-type intramembrane protease [Geodermatophilus amargosae]SFU06952.1 hypothetical protein SAMN05660657_05340 [Geodermatophilus amargosae]